DGMQIIGSIARASRAARIWKEIGQQHVAPTGAVIQRSIGIQRLDVGPHARYECRVADVDQSVRPSRLVSYPLAPDANARYFNAIESPASYWNCARDAGCIVGRRIETSVGIAGHRACNIHLNLSGGAY